MILLVSRSPPQEEGTGPQALQTRRGWEARRWSRLARPHCARRWAGPAQPPRGGPAVPGLPLCHSWEG